MSTPLHPPLAATLLAAILVVPVASLPAAEVRIKNQATVSGNVIRLEDVADVVESNAIARKRLQQILLAPAPAAGREMRITYADVRNRLQSAGIDLSRVNFRGSAAVRVRSAAAGAPNTIRGVEFVRPGESRRQNQRAQRAEKVVSKAVEQYLRRAAPELGGVNVRAELNAKDVDGVLSAFNGAYAVQSQKRPRLGAQGMRILFRDRRRRIHNVSVLCIISGKPYVLAARNRIPRGTIVQKYDVELIQTDSDDRGFTRLADVVGNEAKRTIIKGAVLAKTDLRRLPLVRVNDMVTVIVRIGDISVSREMIAKKAGARGESIALADPKTRQIITATVTGRNEAEVVRTRRTRLTSFRDRTGSIEFRDAPSTRRRKPSITTPAAPPRRLSRDFRRFRNRTSGTSRRTDSKTGRLRRPGQTTAPIADNFQAVSGSVPQTRVVDPFAQPQRSGTSFKSPASHR